MPTELTAAVEGKKRRGVFPGYGIVASGGILCLWGYGVYLYSFGNYVKALIDSFGWSRAQISLAYSFGRLEGGLEGPLGGIATDKFGPRAITLWGGVLAGVGLLLMSLVNSLWLFYLAWIMVATGFNLGLADALDAAIANWFVRKRGMMGAIMRSVVGFAGPTVVTGTMWLLLVFGWKNGFAITGAATLLLAVPLSWFFIKPRRPEYYGWLPDGRRLENGAAPDAEAQIKAGVEYAAQVKEVEFTVRQALRDRTWWLCVVSMTLRGMVTPAVTVHTVPFLTDMGISEMLAATAMGMRVFLTIPGRLIFGWLGDRTDIKKLRYLVILANLIQAVGLFLFTRITSMAWVWAYVVVYGFSDGAAIMAWPPLRGRYWGRKAYATIQGAMQPITMIGGIVAPVYAGWVYDTTGSYLGAFNVMLLFLVASAAIMVPATPPKPPKQIGKITDVF